MAVAAAIAAAGFGGIAHAIPVSNVPAPRQAGSPGPSSVVASSPLNAPAHLDTRDLGIPDAPLARLTVQSGRDASRAGSLGARLAQDFDGLFQSGPATVGPVDGLTDGGGFMAAAIALAGNLHFHVAASALTPQQHAEENPLATSRALTEGSTERRQAVAGAAGLSWDFADWGALGLSASHTDESAGLLASSPLEARTDSIGLSARLGFGDGWVTTFGWREGVTQLSLRPEFAAASTALHSRSYGVAVAKHGLFSNNDAIGLSVSRPGAIYNGGIDLAAPTGVDLTRSLIGNNLALNGRPETDLEVGYVTTFFDGALALQANAGYQMNVAGQRGSNAVTVLSRAKINF